MTERKFDSNQPPRPIFSRSIEGRLRPASGVNDNRAQAHQTPLQPVEAIPKETKNVVKEQQKHRFFSRKKAATSPTVVPPASKPKEIALTLSLPRIPRLPNPKTIFKKLPKVDKKSMLVGGSIVLVVAVGLGVYGFAKPKHSSSADGNGSTGVLSADSQAAQSPEYNTILPKGTNIEALGGWGRVSPPDKEPVFAYADKIGDVLINVSEQPLPDSLAQPDQLEKMAKGFNANDKLAVGDTTAYLGTSAKGPQTFIVAKEDLLILIKSAVKLTNQQWIDYVENLE